MDEIDGEERWDSGRFGLPQFDLKHLKLCRGKSGYAGIIYCCIRALMGLWSLGIGGLILEGAWRELGGS